MRRSVGGLCLLAALVAPVGASGQGTSGTVNATATIVGTLQVFDETGLDFGSIVPGTGAVVAPGALPASGALGHLRVEHTSNFTVSSTVPTQLVNGAETIDVSFECGYSAAQNGGLTGGQFDCAAPAGSPATVPGTPTVTYLQVGGTILAGATTGKPPGVYTASLTFTFTSTL